jgi:hypothetical protein
MPDFISCPRCGYRLQMLLALPGQQVRCGGCGHCFEAETIAPSPTERIEPLEALPAEEQPRRPEPPRRRENEPLWPDADRRPPPALLDLPLRLRSIADEDEEGLPYCPGCGRRVRWEAMACPTCEEEFEDDRDLRRQHRRLRGSLRDTAPHRADTIGNLANVGLTCGILSLCFGVAALAGLPLGIAAWVMANNDLEAMRNGVLDGRGRQKTLNARGNAVTGVIFAGLFGSAWVLFWFWFR